MANALIEEAKKIFPKLAGFEGFYLAGGTALALQVGHRVSVDFDLFSPSGISKQLLAKVEKVFAGSKINVAQNSSDELTVFVDGVKITFLRYPFGVYKNFVETDGLKILAPETIALTKAYTIGRRGSYKDYVDLYFLLSGEYTTLENILQDCQKIYSDAFSDRLFLEQLVYMKDIDEIEIRYLDKKVKKGDLEEFFEIEVREFGKTHHS